MARIGIEVFGDFSPLLRDANAAMAQLQRNLDTLARSASGPAAVSRGVEESRIQASAYGQHLAQSGLDPSGLRSFFQAFERNLQTAVTSIGPKRLQGFQVPALTPQLIRDLEITGQQRNRIAGGYIPNESGLLVSKSSLSGATALRRAAAAGGAEFDEGGEASALQKHISALEARTDLLRRLARNEDGALVVEREAVEADAKYRRNRQRSINLLEGYPTLLAELFKEENLFKTALARARLAVYRGVEATAERNAAERELAIAERRATLAATEGQIGEEAALALDEARRKLAISLEQERLVTDQDRIDRATLAAEERKGALLQRQADILAGGANVPLEANNRLIERGAKVDEGLADIAAFNRLSTSQQAKVIEGEAAVASFRKRQAAQIEETTQKSLAADTAYINSTAAAARARKSIEVRTAAATAGVIREPGESDDALKARTDYANQVQKLRDKAASQAVIQDRINAGDRELLQLKATTAATQRKINRDLFEQQRIIDRENGVRASLFQRLQQSLHARGTGGFGGGGGGGDLRSASEFPRFGQFIGQKALTTAGFAVSGALFYGIANGIREVVREASELEKILNQVESQFESVGDGAEFRGFREAILDISRETGAAADEVAFVGFQMKGAFGDTAAAVEATSSAIRIARVTGLELNEVVDSLTAASLSFGRSIEDVGDSALGVQERFGVLAKEIIKGVADLAPVAEEVGLTLEQTTALIGTAQQASGRAGASISEAFGRILPALSAQVPLLLEIFAGNKRLSGSYDELLGYIGSNNLGGALDLLIRRYGDLTAAEQQQIITAVGGRREAAALISVLQNGGKYFASLNAAPADAGKLNSYFEDLQKTVTQSLSRVRQQFTLLGEQLFRAGLADFFKDLLAIVGGVAGAFALLFQGMSLLNDLTDGFAGRIIALTLAMKALLAVSKQLAAIEALRGISGAFSRGRTTATAGAALTGLELAAARTSGTAAVTAASGRAVGALSAARASGSAVVAALGGPWTVGITALAAAAFTWKSKIDEARRSNTARLKEFSDGMKYSRAQLEALAAEDNSLWEDLKGTYLKQDTPGDTARRVISRQDSRDVRTTFRTARETRGLLFDQITRQQVQKELEAQGKGDLLQDYYGKALPTAGGGIAAQVARLTGRAQSGKFSEADLKALQKVADKGGPAADEAKAIIEAIIAVQTSTQKGAEELRAVIQDAAREKGYRDKPKIDKKNMEEAAKTYEEVVAAFQAGEVSFTEYSRVAGSRLDQLNAAIAAGAGGLGPQRAKLLKEINKATADFMLQQLEFAESLTSISGVSELESLDVRIANLNALLRNPRFKDPDARAKAIRDLVAAEKERIRERIARAATIADVERLAIEGVPLSDVERQGLIEEQLRTSDERFLNFTETIFTAVNSRNRFIQRVAKAAATGLEEDKQKAIDLLNEQLAKLPPISYIDLGPLGRIPVPDVGKAAAIEAEKQRIRNGDYGAGVPESLRLSPEDQAAAIRARKAADVARRQAETENPVEQALIELRDAEAELLEAQTFRLGGIAEDNARARIANAQRAVRDANRAIEDAQLNLLEVQAGDNAVAQAQAAQRKADLAASRAADETDRINALALRIQADRQMQDALAAVQDAQLNLIATMADIGGDVVGAATARAKAAVAALNAAIAQGKGEEVLAPLRGQVATAQAAIADASRNESIRQIDVALALEEITTQEAISRLQALLEFAYATGQSTQEIDELRQKIFQLTKSASQDLQFGIAPDILPTLYEGRRLNQQGTYGPNAQAPVTNNDNRTIIFSPIIATTVDAAALIANVEDVVTRPSRTVPGRIF